MSVIWFFLSCFLIGFGKAARDTIAHHFADSVFLIPTGKNPSKLRLWFRKWFFSKWDEWPLHFGIFRLDAWHFFDMLHYIGMAALVSSVVYYRDMDIFAGPAALAVIGFVFIVFYKMVLVKGK